MTRSGAGRACWSSGEAGEATVMGKRLWGARMGELQRGLGVVIRGLGRDATQSGIRRSVVESRPWGEICGDQDREKGAE